MLPHAEKFICRETQILATYALESYRQTPTTKLQSYEEAGIQHPFQKLRARWPGQARPSQARQGQSQARPSQARPRQARPGQARQGEFTKHSNLVAKVVRSHPPNIPCSTGLQSFASSKSFWLMALCRCHLRYNSDYGHLFIFNQRT